jgi:hypothetical protein
MLPNLSTTTTTKVNSQSSGGLLQDIKDALNESLQTETTTQGEAAAKRQREFDYTVIQYPSDLARNSRHPYWMTFYINKQELSHFKSGSSAQAFATGDTAGVSTVQRNANQTNTANRNLKTGGPSIGFGRKTQRTTTAIRLFIPDTLSWSFQNSFRDASLSGIPFSGLAQTVTSLGSLLDSQQVQKEGGAAMGPLASIASKFNNAETRATIGAGLEKLDHVLGAGNEGLGLSAVGIAVNPQVDVLYGSPELRTFTFDFLFAPRNQKEADSVSKIIQEFKFHASPEALGGGIGLGRYFVPPSEFDIEFSVTSMGKISTCVLQNVTVDYAPSGVAFYADGKPVGTRMTLQFKELEYITKELVEKGY